ncbi:MAG: PQQ-binding-like beta-propeller repeat protein [Phycisphaeraceae bacterium]|nr:PQQ-binding-like beta-propeller repeat protein [Phycisphaeraceae bacterium]MCW5764249.1 PQQ-binding-like beta-propeller repeat protein [Phycisphaeraceae bacterium]
MRHLFFILLILLLLASTAPAQVSSPENPVFLDDSAEASDVLAGLAGLTSRGSSAEALRTLQTLLDHQPFRLLASTTDPDLFVSVRQVVHDRLMADPALLGSYRQTEQPQARALLEAGRLAAAFDSRFLTPSGFEAGLRLAQLQLERAQFESSLRTLTQLTTHPDFNSRKRDLAAVLTVLARYLQHDGARALLELLELDLPQHPINPPASLRIPIVGPFGPGPQSDLTGVVPRPLSSAPLAPPIAAVDEDMPEAFRDRFVSTQSPFGWTLPTAASDIIYSSDGDFITAWDRFTLRQIWRVERTQPTGDGLFQQRDPRRRQSRRIEDSTEVSVAGNRLVAVTGIAINGFRQGDSRIHCLDRHTGRPIWAVDPAALDPQLIDGSVRGAPIIVEQTVVVAVRKSARDRRIISLYLVGLDLADGSLQWTRLLGSAGALPFQQGSRFPERLAAHRGVIYRADEIGLIAAVEAATGNTIWVRRSPSFRLYDSDVRPAWSSSGPIIDRDRIISLSPNREFILAIDPDSGAILGSQSAAFYSNPVYLLHSAEHLVALSDNRVAWTRLADFPSNTVQLSAGLGNPSIVGRSVVAGQTLIIPRSDRITTINLHTGQQQETVIDAPGNLLALNGQLIATDASNVHSYMVWDVASRLLQDRIDADPSSPAAAATLAELAFRAGRSSRIIPAVDRAITAIDRNRLEHEQVRSALYAAVLGMLDRAGQPAPDASAEARLDDLELLRALSLRLETLADTPREQVAHRLVDAWIAEASGSAPQAVESLQMILAEPSLASSFWLGGLLTIRADLEATRRLRELLTRRGWAAYAGFEREARAQLELAGPDPDHSLLERFARQYPFSTLAPSLYLEAARKSQSVNQLSLLQRGLRAAAAIHQLGAPLDESVARELVGRSMTLLHTQGRFEDARTALNSLDLWFPSATPTFDTIPLSPDRLASLTHRESREQRRPMIGSRIAPDTTPTLEQGRVLQPTLLPARPTPANLAVLVSQTSQTVRLVQSTGTELRTLWNIPAPLEPLLLEISPTTVTLAWLDPQGIIIEALNLNTGQSQWRHKPFDLSERRADRRPMEFSAFITPLEGRVFGDQILIAGDDHVLAIAERSGRIVTLDRTTGEPLWSGSTDVRRVYDIAINAGMLVVGGSVPQPNEQWALSIISVDARTGNVVNRLNDPPGNIRWMRVTPQRLLVAGLDRGVLCVDLEETDVRWMLAEEPVTASLDAWIFDDRLYVLDQNRSLWQVSIATGRLVRPELDTRGRLVDRIGIQAYDLGDTITFLSGSGMLVYDASGTLQGIDVFETVGSLIVSDPATDHVVLLESSPVEDPEGFGSFPLYIMALDSAHLISSQPVRLHAPPESITVLDGLILISAGEATLVLQAPRQP